MRVAGWMYYGLSPSPQRRRWRHSEEHGVSLLRPGLGAVLGALEALSLNRLQPATSLPQPRHARSRDLLQRVDMPSPAQAPLAQGVGREGRKVGNVLLEEEVTPAVIQNKGLSGALGSTGLRWEPVNAAWQVREERNLSTRQAEHLKW